MACISNPATMICNHSRGAAGQRGRAISTIGARQSRPTIKRRHRNVNGAAYWIPALVARKPEPQMKMKYQVRKLLEKDDLPPPRAAVIPGLPRMPDHAGPGDSSPWR